MTSTLLGLAIGDALGVPFETQHFASSALASWDGKSYRASPFHGTKAGEGTDDTLMALALAEALAVDGEFNGARVARHYVEAWQKHPGRGWGNATTDALQRLAAGVDWTRSGSNSEGNGSAMRAAALGLAFGPTDAARWARLDATITHASLEAQEGSAAMAAAVSFLRGPGVVEGLVAGTVSYGDVLSWVVDLLQPSKVRSNIERVLAGGWILPTVLALDIGTGAHVVESVPTALGTLVTATSYEDAVVSVIHAGGDTDTVAAMTGALWGTMQRPRWHLIKGLDVATAQQAIEVERKLNFLTM